MGLFYVFLERPSRHYIGLHGQSDLVWYKELFPGYREVILKAYAMAELSGLEIDLISKYSHQNGVIARTAFCEAHLYDTTTIFPILGNALNLCSNRINLGMIQQSFAEQ